MPSAVYPAWDSKLMRRPFELFDLTSSHSDAKEPESRHWF